MTKKKRGHPDVDEVLSRPWCYYCERDFDDLKILINHQKAKHFKCERCGRRLNTAGGLSVHMSQVHKENLTAVDNALPNRAGLDIEIFGMEGIPEDIVQQHNQRVLTNFHQALAERQAAAGNAAAGGAAGNAAKKPKTESISDLKKRLAEHKAAKLAAEHEGGGSSGSATPVGAGQTQHQSQNTTNPASPNYPAFQQPYAAPPTNGAYGQPPSLPQTQTASTYPGQAPYGQAASPSQPTFGQAVPQPYAQNQPYPLPPQPSFQQQPPVSYPAQPSFSPPPYQNQPPFPGQPFPSNAPPGSYPGQNAGPPRPYGVTSPFAPYQQQHVQNAIPPNSSLPQPVRTGSVSLPSAPGLPQRPAFGAPPVNALQFQQMHQGQIPTSQNHTMQPQFPRHDISLPPAPQMQNGLPQSPPNDMPSAASIDDLISSASKKADTSADMPKTSMPQPVTAPPSEAAVAPTSAPAQASVKEDVIEEKNSKKDKDKDKPKATRLVYSDNEISPEEKMAQMPKYAFTPAQKSIMV